ncbi:hypothetical protein GWI33_008282 [Rhynchophorus ferrugineus]|uniref:Uncharacterized protein n=1 Tax=Rhynchophorus ferrugineus TaxID=354439 RepID=A0A834IVQ3_RHYFE|nr:hypothetical protein GWI33_008282 [Rhynchophorus ferrugineus]
MPASNLSVGSHRTTPETVKLYDHGIDPLPGTTRIGRQSTRPIVRQERSPIDINRPNTGENRKDPVQLTDAAVHSVEKSLCIADKHVLPANNKSPIPPPSVRRRLTCSEF